MEFIVIQEWLVGLVPYLITFAVVMLLDLILGVIAALLKGEFDWERLPEFALNAAQYFMAWMAAELLMLLFQQGPEITGFEQAVQSIAPKAIYSFVVLKYVASIAKKIEEFTGLPSP